MKRPTTEVVREKIAKWRDDYELGGEISKIFKEAQVRKASEAYSLHHTSRLLTKYFNNKYKLANPEELDFIEFEDDDVHEEV